MGALSGFVLLWQLPLNEVAASHPCPPPHLSFTPTQGNSSRLPTSPPGCWGPGALDLGRSQLPAAPVPALPFHNFMVSAVLGQVSQVAQRAAPSIRSAALLPAAAQQLYTSALGQAATVISHATVDATTARRLTLGSELQTWLSSLPSSMGFPNTLQTARPEELLVFMQSSFIREHAGSRLPGSTELVASPQGVSCAFSHLSTLFESLGRRGPYDALSRAGNPCDSAEIRRYKQGYGRDLWQAGYQETSAVPMSEALTRQLIQHIDTLVSQSSSSFEKLLHLRDGLLLLFAWYSAMRGKEGGELCLPDLHWADCSPYFPNGYLPGTPVPSEIWVYPTHGTKTNKRSRIHQDPAHVEASSDPLMCFPSRLWSYLELSLASGHPISHFLFRPQTAVRGHFKESAYSSSSFGKMLQNHLSSIGKHTGETGHSFRRGTLQATASKEGMLAAAVQGRIKTPAILQRYLDPYRHLGRVPPTPSLPSDGLPSCLG